MAGKCKRNDPLPKESRLALLDKTIFIPPVNKEKGFAILDELEKVANNHNGSMAQAAINYLIDRPGISTIVLGVRNKEQLKDNLDSLNWKIDQKESGMLDKVSELPINYPYWHQMKHN